MCCQPFKSSVRIYRTFFKGINKNSGWKRKTGDGKINLHIDVVKELRHSSILLLHSSIKMLLVIVQIF
jgi:hypothetical protein